MGGGGGGGARVEFLTCIFAPIVCYSTLHLLIVCIIYYVYVVMLLYF